MDTKIQERSQSLQNLFDEWLSRNLDVTFDSKSVALEVTNRYFDVILPFYIKVYINKDNLVQSDKIAAGTEFCIYECAPVISGNPILDDEKNAELAVDVSLAWFLDEKKLLDINLNDNSISCLRELRRKNIEIIKRMCSDLSKFTPDFISKSLYFSAIEGIFLSQK